MKATKELQPNFELIKTAFYLAFIDSEKADFEVLKESINGGHLLPAWHKRKEVFKKDFSRYLDGLDIRNVGSLVLLLKSQNKPVPKWAANWKYNIGYNENGMLDLIRIDGSIN